MAGGHSWDAGERVRASSLAPKQKDIRKDVLLFWAPAAEAASPLRHLNARGRQSHPCAKVFPCGENACAAHSRRGPEGPFGGSSAIVSSIQNIDFNRPFQKETLTGSLPSPRAGGAIQSRGEAGFPRMAGGHSWDAGERVRASSLAPKRKTFASRRCLSFFVPPLPHAEMPGAAKQSRTK